MVVGGGYFSHESSQSENVASACRVLNYQLALWLSPGQGNIFNRREDSKVSLMLHPKRLWEWPLCVIASDEQISQPSLVWKQNSSHLHSLCVGILFNCTALGIHLCKTSQLYILKTRLGGEIYSSDVNMHKGYLVVLMLQSHQWALKMTKCF